MQIINMSKTKLNSLEPLILPKNVTSTECELFKYPYYGKEKLLKKLHRTDGIIFANKLYTIEALNANKDSMPSNFVLPESLVSINKKIEVIKSIGRILEQMQNIRKYTNLNNFYLGDIHEDNFLVERDKQEVYIVDLDSCKIAGNKSFPGRYLTNSSLIKYNNTKYQTLSQTDDLADYKIDENTDIYCYIIMILNYLYDGRVDRLSLDKFYDFINYLEDIKVNIELIECFNKIVVGGNNINPCNYLDTLTPKQVAGARRLYKKK